MQPVNFTTHWMESYGLSDNRLSKQVRLNHYQCRSLHKCSYWILRDQGFHLNMNQNRNSPLVPPGPSNVTRFFVSVVDASFWG